MDKLVFYVREAAAAIHGITRDHKDDTPNLNSTINELIHAIKSGELPAKVPQRAYAWTMGRDTLYGRILGETKTTPDYRNSTIARADLLAWIEKRDIRPRPPLLFPDDPLALPAPADSSRFKESDLLVTIYRLLLLAVDLQKEADHNTKHKNRRYMRGSSISKSAVWGDIEALLKQLGISAAGLGGTKTRDILTAACQLGPAVPEEEA